MENNTTQSVHIRNLYYHQVLRRRNVLMEWILNFFLSVASYPRLMLEVFLRKNFGIRYFSLATAITITIILLLLPHLWTDLFPHAPGTFRDVGEYNDYMNSRHNPLQFQFIGWYFFTILFFLKSIQRHREIMRHPGIFDFNHFSLYAGDIDPRFLGLKEIGLDPTVRNISELYEPALFFVAGVFLHIIGQKLGVLFIVSSLFYGFGYRAAYKMGDNFVWDQVDEILMNEERENAFVGDLDGPETRGVRFLMDKPNSEAMRRKVAEAMVFDPTGPAQNVFSF